MKKFLFFGGGIFMFIVGFFCFALQAHAAISLVQAASSTSAGGTPSMSLKFPGNNAAGNAIIIATEFADNNVTSTCTDTLGNTYVSDAVLQYDATHLQGITICYALNIKGGANTTTITFSGTPDFDDMFIHEYSGVAKTKALDVTSTQNISFSNSTNGISSGAVTTTANGELVFGADTEVSGAGSNLSAGTGFTTRAVDEGSNVYMLTEDLIQATAGVASATFTQGSTAFNVAQMATFGAAPSTGSIAFVQSTSTFPPTASQIMTKAFGSNVAKGDVIIVGTFNAVNAPVTATDTLGDTFVVVASSTDTADHDSLILIATTSAAGADSVTLNAGSGNNIFGFSIHEYNGLAIDSIAHMIDTTSTAGHITAASTTLTVPGLTTTNPNDLVFAYFPRQFRS